MRFSQSCYRDAGFPTALASGDWHDPTPKYQQSVRVASLARCGGRPNTVRKEQQLLPTFDLDRWGDTRRS